MIMAFKIKNELFRGSIILLLLMNLGNIINYLYQIAMARMLGPANYGILAVLISITYVFATPALAIQTAVVKKISRLNYKKEYGKMKGMVTYFLKRLFIFSIFIFVIFSISALWLAKPLDIPFWLLVLTGTIIITSFVYPIFSGSLQGMKKFSTLGWNTIAVFSVKLIIAILLVALGFKIYGAMIGFVVGVVAGIVLAVPYLKEIFNSHKEGDGTKILTKENTLIFTAILIFVFIYSFDVVLAKLFFSKEVVGQYAVISMIGKIVLFSTMSIGYAMFPISSEKHDAKVPTRNLARKAFLSVAGLCSIALILFALFPEWIINLLFGKQYISISHLLIYIGIAFSFIALLNVVILYRISTDEFNIRHLFLLMVFFTLQIILLSVYRKSIEQFTIAFMFSTIITFIGAFIFVRSWKR